MYKLYKEKELTFSILMIVAYCVLNILATQLNNMVGTDTVFFQMIFTILLVIILFAFIFKNGLKEKYGLNKIKISYKEALFFIPIVIIATRNIWFGFSWNMSLSTTVIYVIRMAFVGICEELLFRGFLYKAIEKDNKVEAIERLLSGI